MLSSDDFRHCQNVINELRNEKNNYLFLEPFDLSVVPGYTDVVKRVMDLTTLSKNLEAGEYPNRDAFAKDCFLIYENAIAYHSSRDETCWIAKIAKAMLRIAKNRFNNVERQKAASSVIRKNRKLLPTRKNKKAILKLKFAGNGRNRDASEKLNSSCMHTNTSKMPTINTSNHLFRLNSEMTEQETIDSNST